MFFVVSSSNTHYIFQDQEQRIMEESSCDSDSSDDLDSTNYQTHDEMVKRSADSQRITSSNLPLLFASGKPQSLDTITQVRYQFKFISNLYLYELK